MTRTAEITPRANTVTTTRPRLGSGLILLAVAVLVAACGQARSPAGGAASRHISARAAAAAQADVDQLYVDIAGSADQRSAGSRLAYHLEKDPFTACMKAAGIDYTPMPFVDDWQGWPARGSSTFSTAWLAPIDDPDHLPRVEQAQAAAQRAADSARADADAAYGSLSDSDRQAWDSAVASCEEGSNFAEAWHPDPYYPLVFAFHDLVDTIDEGLGKAHAAAYTKCMAAAGYDGLANHQDLLSMLESKLPARENIPDPGGQGGASWQAWLSLEQAASTADATCRLDAYTEGIGMLAPKTASFRADHAQELADEAVGWDKITGSG